MNHRKIGEVRFIGRKWNVLVVHYQNNNRPGLILAMKNESDDPYDYGECVATVNLAEVDLAPNEVIVKNYSENEGILDALLEGGIVDPPSRFVRLPYVEVPICRVPALGRS